MSIARAQVSAVAPPPAPLGRPPAACRLDSPAHSRSRFVHKWLLERVSLPSDGLPLPACARPLQRAGAQARTARKLGRALTSPASTALLAPLETPPPPPVLHA